MNKKVKNHKLKTITFSTLLILLVASAYVTTVAAQDEILNTMWVEPSVIQLDPETTPVGYKFNVTIWADLTNDTYTWQVTLYFNNTQLNAVRAGYTVGTKSEWATHSSTGATIPVTPEINNVTGYVKYGESLLGFDEVTGPVVASLCWIEFQVKLVPEPGVNVTSLLDINNIDTFFLNPDLDEIPLKKNGATYIIPELTSIMMLLTIAQVSITLVTLRRKLK